MSYIGNSPITAAFLTDTFSGNGSTTAFTMSIAPAGPTSCIVAITGVVQDPSTYSTSGTTLTFSAAPPPGTNNISVRYLGIPASGVTTTAYRTLTETTATAGQTSFSVPSYTVGFINVYRNGALLGTADYTATTGTTVVLATGATAGDLVVVESFYVSSVLNAVPNTGGSITGNLVLTGTLSGSSSIASNGASGAGGSLVAGRVDSSSEGGQLDLCRSTDNTSAWAIDVYGNTSTPSLRFVDNVAAAARMTVDSSGNLGLNVTPSPWTDFKGIQIGSRFSAVSEGTVADLYLNSYYASGSYRYIANGYATQYRQQDGKHIFYNAASGTAGNTFSYTQAMTLDSSGNLLVGITSVSANNSKSMFFDVQQGYQSIQHSTANTSGNYFIGFAYNGSYIGNIAQNGTTATAYNTSSDYRLKENIAPMTGALATVAQLKPVTYTWKADGSEGQGFIAHELQAVVPDCVTGEKDAVDEEGNPVYQGIDTSFLVATLTAAIQEQQELIKQLQADVAELKGAK